MNIVSQSALKLDRALFRCFREFAGNEGHPIPVGGSISWSSQERSLFGASHFRSRANARFLQFAARREALNEHVTRWTSFALLHSDRLYALYVHGAMDIRVHARRVRRLAYSIPFCRPIPNLHASRTIDRELDFSRAFDRRRI